MKSVLCLLAALLTAYPVVAQNTENKSSDDPENNLSRFDDLVITATRTETSRRDVIAPVIVIDRAEIELSQAMDLAALLKFHAGIDIARNGGPGQLASVFVRGTESNHVLFMIDGVKINPGTIGGAAVQNISPQNIERVEIVKGPRSSLYGSEAIGGVINIITRSNANIDESGFSAYLGTGKYSTQQAGASLQAPLSIGHFKVSADWYETDGFPTLETDSIDRGYDNLTLNLEAGARIGPVDVTLHAWQAEGNTEYSDFFATPVDQDYTNRTVALDLSAQPLDNWSTRLNLSSMLDDIEQQQSMDFIETDRFALDWQNDVYLGDRHVLTAGTYISREDTDALSFGLGFDEDTDIDAYYLQDAIDLDRHSLLLAARYTDHETFGTEKTWNVDYGFSLGGAGLLTAGIGTGFRAPDATDRFGFGGNPMLEPEQSRNYELGYRLPIKDNQIFTINAFYNEIDDLINFVVTDPMTFAGENLNVDNARIRGIETSYELSTELWWFRAEAVVQDPENTSDNQRLFRRAKRSLTTSIARQVGRHRFGLQVLASDDRKDFGFPRPSTTLAVALANT